MLLAPQRLEVAVDAAAHRAARRARPRRRGRTACRSPPRARRPRARRPAAARSAPRAAPGSSAAPRSRRLRGGDPGIALAAQRALVDQHPQRSRRGTAGCPRSSRGSARSSSAGSSHLAEQAIDERPALAGVERLELDHVARPAARHGQRLARLAQLGAGQRDEQHRRVADPLDEVLDQVEQHRLTPVQVVEHEHERALAGERPRAPGAAPRTSPAPMPAPPTPSTPADRSTSRSRSGSSAGTSAASFSRTTSAGSASPIPATSRRTSATGRNVMPSPRRLAVAVTTAAWSRHRGARTPRASRLLPRPGEPITLTSRQARAASASSSAARRRPARRARPTSGASTAAVASPRRPP